MYLLGVLRVLCGGELARSIRTAVIAMAIGVIVSAQNPESGVQITILSPGPDAYVSGPTLLRRARRSGRGRVGRGILRRRPSDLRDHRAAVGMRLGCRAVGLRTSGAGGGDAARRRTCRADRAHQVARLRRAGQRRGRAGDGDGRRRPRPLRARHPAQRVSHLGGRQAAGDHPLRVRRRAARSSSPPSTSAAAWGRRCRS